MAVAHLCRNLQGEDTLNGGRSHTQISFSHENDCCLVGRKEPAVKGGGAGAAVVAAANAPGLEIRPPDLGQEAASLPVAQPPQQILLRRCWGLAWQSVPPSPGPPPGGVPARGGL